MEATIPYRRKIIALKEDTFRALSIMVAEQGTNLKRLTEAMLDEATDEYDENEPYHCLSENYPGGEVMLGKEEHKESIDWLRVVEKRELSFQGGLERQPVNYPAKYLNLHVWQYRRLLMLKALKNQQVARNWWTMITSID